MVLMHLPTMEVGRHFVVQLRKFLRRCLLRVECQLICNCVEIHIPYRTTWSEYQMMDSSMVN